MLQNYVANIPGINFPDYDLWTYNVSQNSWDFAPDGVIDMIIMDYRYVPDNENYWFMQDDISGRSILWDNGDITIQGKVIKAGFGEIPQWAGSGVTGLGQLLNYSGVSQIIEHEIAHYFFRYNLNAVGDNSHTTNGLMVGVDATAYNMSPYERNHPILGWNINPVSVTSTGTYTLGDYVSTGQMLKIPIPGTTDEWFWAANHQKTSNYDGISRGGKNCWAINKGRQDPYCSDGKGLFIYHESSLGCGNNYGKSFDIEQADGKWQWVVDRWVQYYDPQYNICIPLFEHHSPNGRNPNTGKAEYLQEIMFISNPEPCFPWGSWPFSQGVSDNPCSESLGDYFVTLDANGDGKDGFNFGYDQIFSPYSNPASNSCQSPETNTGITVNLVSKDENGNITIKIYFDDNLALNELPPAKPKNLKALKEPVGQFTEQFYPKNRWDGNNELDFLSGGSYKIYRGFSLVCNPDADPQYIHIATVSNLTTEYIDYSIRLFPSGGGSRQCEREFQSYSYKVQAVDYTNKPSLQSDRVIINGYLDPCAPEDRPNYNNNEIINKFNFFNYPNPFNPSTEIKFDLPQNTFVTLRVYNAVGQVVAELVNNEYKTAGRYSVSFDGSKLASGIYFYSIEAGMYKDVKKMVLIK